jgi:probable F420-dependent oxidoreductase
MRVGFCLPQFGDQAREASQAGRLAVFAAEAEQLGAHSLWVGDRLMAPVDPVVGYGGTAAIPEQFRTVLDPFAVLTIAATATRSAWLGTSVLNLPWYPPVMVARSLTTIDVVSGGRLLPGFGIGWSPDEYQAANVPWPGRGARLEESLDALEAIWGPGPAAYAGAAWTMPASHVDLRPVQQPHPPVYLGGLSEAALARVGRRADGWTPVIRLPGYADPGFLIQQREVISRAADASGRDAGEIATALRVNAMAGTTADEIVTAMDQVERMTGIDHMFVDLLYLAAGLTQMLDLAARILELAAGR